MAITNSQIEVDLTTISGNSYLNLPITAGISNSGYWYYYTPVNANNSSISANITPYRWGNALPMATSTMVIDGTFALLTETWDGANVKYHNGCIEWIGPGTNDITNEVEDDAFFFAHLGTLSTAPDDDVYYWDRAFEPDAGTDWEYYQYHQHSPTSYPQYENGRQVLSANGFIDPNDPAFGYMISVQVKSAGVTYSSVLGRVHTPSVGGAHNSHNDVTLPSVANKNYLPGGIVRGIGERFHCFYITASGGDWEVFNRTYTDAAASFTAQVSLGTFNLADPFFSPTLNQQSQYPVRASCGTSFGSRIYFPVILNNTATTFDLEIWSFNSLDTIAGGSLVRQVLSSNVAARPDCFCATLGTTALYALFTDVPNGGTDLWKYDGTTWSSVGSFLTNNSADPIRVHGFKFNSEDFKWYALLSGNASGGGSYTGSGLYSFELDDAFTGYKHLDYDATTNSFVERNQLSTGYVKYTPSSATFTRINDTEPQAIAADTVILNYQQPDNQWFNRKSIGFGGKEYYFQTITLNDGRRLGVGQVSDNENNLGATNSGDFLVSIFKPDLGSAIHLAFGSSGDDYLTSCWEDAEDKKIYLTGYCKGPIVPKGDIWIHGWCRNFSDGGNALEWADMTVDPDGNVYLIGSHDSGWVVVAKYDKNYILQWQKEYGDDASLTDIGKGIAVDGTDAVYYCGSTQEGVGGVDALLVKLNPSTGVPVWAKILNTDNVTSETATSVAVITKANTKYVVTSITSGTTTTFVVTDTDGNIVEQNLVANLVVNKIKYNQTSSNVGRFLFAGNDGNVTTKGLYGLCEISSNTRFVQWICGHDATQSVQVKDIINLNSNIYAICGNIDDRGFVTKVSSIETGAGSWTVTKSWTRTIDLNAANVANCHCSYNSITSTPYTEANIQIYVAGTAMGPTIPQMGMEEAVLASFSESGTLLWQTAFGHDMDEKFVTVSMDSLNRNIIAAGWSESHSDSRDAIFFRADKNGFGTGIYNLTETGTSPYYYNASNYLTAANVDTFTQETAPANSAGSFSSNAYSLNYQTSLYLARDFDGPIGPNGVFTGVVGWIDLDLLQQYQNTDEFKQAQTSGHSLTYVSNISSIGSMYQFATVGDGSADDGNIFSYDVIKHSNGDVYVVGQTSGDITKYNTGLSGVYDYLLVELDPTTGELEFYQNGTEKDEETYALTELANGDIAYVGRTTGNLGGLNSGGYDIFLGIFNTNTEVSSYFSIGSGLDDAAVNVHDLGSNTLAVVYSTYSNVTANVVNVGSQDIGVIKFNYATNTWGNAYQTGSSTQELFEQNGKPSALLSNGRLAIAASSTGVFADDAVTFGFLDLCLAILDLNTGEWAKYQLGTAANEISSSVSKAGDTLMIGGNSGGSFDDNIDAIFVEFDAQEGLVGRASSV